MEQPTDPIPASIVNKFDDESMKKRLLLLSPGNKSALDFALNYKNLSFEQCEAIVLGASDEERKEIASLLGDVRMIVDTKEKEVACAAFAEYINSI